MICRVCQWKKSSDWRCRLPPYPATAVLSRVSGLELGCGSCFTTLLEHTAYRLNRDCCFFFAHPWMRWHCSGISQSTSCTNLTALTSLQATSCMCHGLGKCCTVFVHGDNNAARAGHQQFFQAAYRPPKPNSRPHGCEMDCALGYKPRDISLRWHMLTGYDGPAASGPLGLPP